MGESGNQKEPLPIEKSFEELKGIFDCSICQSPFKKPTEIQCGHVYCSHCLKELTKSASKTSNCPLCHKKILRRAMVARDDIEDMQIIIERLTEAFNREMKEYIQEKDKVKVKEKALKENQSTGTPETVRIVPVSSSSEMSINSKEVVNDKEKKKKDLSGKLDKLKKLSEQNYVIMTSSVVPEFSKKTTKRRVSETAMDLSAKGEPVKYVYKEAIKFVKPMDLSMNKKRKLEAEIDCESSKKESLSPSKNASPGPFKRSKTTKEMGNPLTLSSTDSASTSRSSKSFTPGFAGSSECIAKTSSDELLGNLSEDVLIHTEQKRKTRASTNKEKESMKAQVGKKPESEPFVFKQPTVTQTTQSPKPKNLRKSSSSASKTNNSISNNKKVGGQGAGFDDEIRDSDLMFLGINENDIQGGASPKEPPNGKEKITKSAQTPVSADQENASQVACKSKSGTPSSQPTRLSRSRMAKITDAEKALDKSYVRQDDLLGDVAWIEDSFSSNESQPKSKTPDENAEMADSDQGRASSSNKVKQNRYVFCPTRLSKEQMLKLQQLCKICNGTILMDYSPEVTHLIINLASGRVPQTLKYLNAIAGRKWVVIYDWVEKCVSAGSVVPEERFETSNFRQCDPGGKRARLANKDLFTNLKFYFATDTFKNMGYSFENVLTLMTTLGAEVIPSTEDLDLSNNSDLIIIGDRTANSTDYYNWFLTHEWITVTFNWVLDCILAYKIVGFSAKYLCIDLGEEEINVASSALQSQSQFCP